MYRDSESFSIDCASTDHRGCYNLARHGLVTTLVLLAKKDKSTGVGGHTPLVQGPLDYHCFAAGSPGSLLT